MDCGSASWRQAVKARLCCCCTGSRSMPMPGDMSSTALRLDHRVYALDLRGAGRSDAPRGGYDTATRVGDVLAVLDALGTRQATLAGHEFGGWLGFHVALAAPRRVTGLVAMNTPHPWVAYRRLLPHAWRLWHTALFEYPLVGAWVIRTHPAVLRWLLRRGRPDLPDTEVDVYLDLAREPARARAGQQIHRQIVLHDIARRVIGRYRRQRLAMPSILLAGRRDFALAPHSVTGIESRARGIAVRVLDGGHWLPEQNPAAVIDAIRDLSGRTLTGRSRTSPVNRDRLFSERPGRSGG